MDLRKNKKEVVFGRLKQTAAKLWGYQESETEGFDPVVDLLFGACAAEFERLSTELYNSQTRIIEKVSQILLPEVYLRPVPSYAIINAKPINPEKYTKQSDQFIIEKEYKSILSDKPEIRKIYLSPIPDFRLIDIEIKLMATTHEIIQISDLFAKNALCKSKKFQSPHQNKLWLGLSINPAISSLENVSLYFDWFNNPEKNDLLRLLNLARWTVDKRIITVKGGFPNRIEDKYGSETSDISSFLDINLKIEKQIIQFFEEHYITIEEDILPEKRKFPEAFEEFFEIDELQKITEESYWIQIEFPELFPVEFLTETFCTPTAIPVINRRLHDSNRPFTLKEDLNILPLNTEDYFLSVKNIISNNQLNYQEVPFRRMSDFGPGTFTVRTGGIKRFDERDANDYIKYLNELLREEYVSFKSIGSSMIEKELDELQIIINRLQLSVSKSNEIKNSAHFVILKSEVTEDVWLEFWSTTGSFGNNISRGTICLNTDFDKKTLKLITTTTGGKNPPEQIEKTFIFKNELLTRNRVVTKEDIKVLCFAELGHELKDVNISCSPLLGNSRNLGFQNCIKVKLTFEDGKGIEEKENLARHMEKILKHKSSCIYNYRVEAVK